MGPYQKAVMFCYAHKSGIIATPLTARITMSMLTTRFGMNNGMEKFVDLLVRRPPQLEALWKGVMGWMIEGKDSFDSKSAGGWNKAELDGFLVFAQRAGLPNDPTRSAEIEHDAELTADEIPEVAPRGP